MKCIRYRLVFGNALKQNGCCYVHLNLNNLKILIVVQFLFQINLNNKLSQKSQTQIINFPKNENIKFRNINFKKYKGNWLVFLYIFIIVRNYVTIFIIMVISVSPKLWCYLFNKIIFVTVHSLLL